RRGDARLVDGVDACAAQVEPEIVDRELLRLVAALAQRGLHLLADRRLAGRDQGRLLDGRAFHLLGAAARGAPARGHLPGRTGDAAGEALLEQSHVAVGDVGLRLGRRVQIADRGADVQVEAAVGGLGARRGITEEVEVDAALPALEVEV